MGGQLRMNSTISILGARGLLSGGFVQQFVDSEVLRLCDKYTPMQDHMLIDAGAMGTHIGSGQVIWNNPYARYLYYGKLMVGRAPKTLTEVDLNFHGGSMRGASWFERMKADHRNEIIQGAAKLAGGRAKW